MGVLSNGVAPRLALPVDNGPKRCPRLRARPRAVDRRSGLILPVEASDGHALTAISLSHLCMSRRAFSCHANTGRISFSRPLPLPPPAERVEEKSPVVVVLPRESNLSPPFLKGLEDSDAWNCMASPLSFVPPRESVVFALADPLSPPPLPPPPSIEDLGGDELGRPSRSSSL